MPEVFVPAWPGYVEIYDLEEDIGDFDDSIDEALAGGAPLRDSNRDGRRDYTILALSGGGAHGAYGAGVLVGWSERGDRPDLDVVTGVSTGALAGALVFAGPEYDDVLAETYTGITRDDVFLIRPLGIFGSAVGDNAPLRRRVREVVDGPFIDEVAREHRRGRRFFVATTDLDRARVTVWDMGRMALSAHPDREERFEDVIIASAAVPVLFPPVFVPTVDGGHAMHVDGALTEPILLRQHMFDSVRAIAGRGVDIDVHVVVNNRIAVNRPGGDLEPTVPSIAASSLRTLDAAMLHRTLVLDFQRARRAGATFRMTAIPADAEEKAKAIEFDREEMRRLFETGRQAVLDGTAWSDEPPLIGDLDREPPRRSR